MAVDDAQVRAAAHEAATFVPSDAHRRLAEVERVLADFARSEGRAPSGSVLQQVEELVGRLEEQDRQTI